MIAWRDRALMRMEETVKGMEEKCELLEALLACTILKDAAPKENTVTVDISRDALREILGCWKSEAHLTDESYVICLSRCTENRNATGEGKP